MGYDKTMNEHERNTVVIEDEAGTVESEIDPELLQLTADLQSEPEPEQRREIIEQLVDRVRAVDIDYEQVWQIDRALAATISNHPPSFAVLALLGELQPFRGPRFIDDRLAETLELGDGLSDDVIRRLREINTSDEIKDSRQAIKIWEFALEYIATVQDHVEHNLEERVGEPYLYHEGLCLQLFSAAKALTSHLERYRRSFINTSESSPLSSNYLVQKMRQEVVDAQNPDDESKEGALAGVGGGATDQTIYTFAHRLDSYHNRRALGINEGYPIAQPVLAIAPGYYGYYSAGRLQRVYTQADYNDAAAFQSEAKFINHNDPTDEQFDIYDRVNEPFYQGRGFNPSHKLRRLQDIWDFSDHLKRTGRRYFYNLNKVDHDELHPIVDADFLTRNFEYLHAVEGEKNRATPLSGEVFGRLLSPGRELSDDELAAYRTLTSLHMRKKIEDDFGFDLAECDFWTQRLFLSYLERQPLAAVERLQTYTHQFGADGLAAFLTLDDGSDQAGAAVEQFITATETMAPADAREVLHKVSALAERAEGVREWLAEHLADMVADRPELADAVVNGLLKKGRELLQLTNQVDRETLMSRLHEADADLALTVNTFYSLTKQGTSVELSRLPGVEISEASGGSIPPALQQVFTAIAERNWAMRPHMRELVLTGMQEAFNNLRSTFYVIQQKGQVIGFFRLDEQGNDEVYFASMNIPAQQQGYALSHGILAQVLKPRLVGKAATAHCDPWDPVTHQYIGEVGFVASGFDRDYGGTGQPAFTITREDREGRQPHYRYAGLSYQELLQRLQDGDEQIVAYTFSVDPVRTPGEAVNERFMDDLGRRINNGSDVVTNYRRGPRNAEGSFQVLVAYEPRSNSSETTPGAS